MPQYGMVVYSPAPADPMALSPEHLALLDDYPAQAKARLELLRHIRWKRFRHLRSHVTCPPTYLRMSRTCRSM